MSEPNDDVASCLGALITFALVTWAFVLVIDYAVTLPRTVAACTKHQGASEIALRLNVRDGVYFKTRCVDGHYFRVNDKDSP